MLFRSQQEFEKIATYIYETAKGKQGNYMVFFPSYKMMYQVWDCFVNREGVFEELDCICQESGMGEVQREAFLEHFSTKRKKSLIGFCVMGGIFAEGIELICKACQEESRNVIKNSTRIEQRILSVR